MAVLTEGHNYQDYLISNTWSADEGITAQQQPADNIPGMQVEPTSPGRIKVIKNLPWVKIGLVGLGLFGLMLVNSGLSPDDE